MVTFRLCSITTKSDMVSLFKIKPNLETSGTPDVKDHYEACVTIMIMLYMSENI